MSNSIEIIRAINEGRLTDASDLIKSNLNEQRTELFEAGKQYIVESLVEADEEDDGGDDGEGDEGDEYDEEEDSLDEKIITKVNSSGEKTKRKKAPKGFKYIDGKLTKIGASEKRARSKGAKRGNKKKVGQRAAIKRATAKAMKKRKSMGVK